MKIFKTLLYLTILNSTFQNVLLKKKSDYKINYDRQLSNIPNKPAPGKQFVKDLKGYYTELDDMNKKIGYAKRFAFDELGRALGKLENYTPGNRKLVEDEDDDVKKEKKDLKKVKL